VAKLVNPALPPAEAGAIWSRIAGAPCVPGLHEFQRQWIALFQAAGARDARAMAQIAPALLDNTPELHGDGREYLLLAGMSGAIASGRRGLALELWERHAANLEQDAGQPAFRLLRCQAQPGAGEACAAAFRGYAED
jgi:hypothetical protein